MSVRILYAKGGRAIEEARRLFGRTGELPDGGPDKFLLAVLYYAQGSEFKLVSLGPSTVRDMVLGRQVVEYGARPLLASSLARRLAFGKAAFAFVLDSIRFKPTLVLCGLDGIFGLFAWVVCTVSGARLVFLAHGALDLSSSSKGYRFSNKFLCRRAAWVVTHGPFVYQEALALGARKERVVEFNNGLDPEHRRLIEELDEKNLQSRTVLYIGRMEASKGILDLFHAFSAVSPDLGLKLKFIGEGGGTDDLKTSVQAAGLGAKVEIMGAVPFQEIFVHLRQAAVVVTPSRSMFPEGFCKAAMEAFFVGTPVIAPDYGPFPLMVQHEKNGLLYAADSVAGLQAALERFFEDLELRRALEAGATLSGKSLMTPATSFRAAIEAVMASAAV